jgi:hypothetical protein
MQSRHSTATKECHLMAIVIVSLIVLVPLALLGWDLARTKSANAQGAAGFTPTVVHNSSDKVRPNAS